MIIKLKQNHLNFIFFWSNTTFLLLIFTHPLLFFPETVGYLHPLSPVEDATILAVKRESVGLFISQWFISLYSVVCLRTDWAVCEWTVRTTVLLSVVGVWLSAEECIRLRLIATTPPLFEAKPSIVETWVGRILCRCYL
mgnify:CR=1 FL=1